MQLSNRLTFSLASLIVLIALGLVFAPISAIAHTKAESGTAGDNLHPQGDADNPTPEPPAHNHPSISISAKDIDTSTSVIDVLDADTDATDLIIKFEVTLTLEKAVDILDNGDNGNIEGDTFNLANTDSNTYIVTRDGRYRACEY